MEIIIIWVLCGLVAAYIYGKKGRSGVAGFLGGVILGPIGIILALVTNEDKPALEKKAAEEVQEKIRAGLAQRCPHCGSILEPDVSVCRFCGRDVKPKAEEEKAEA